MAIAEPDGDIDLSNSSPRSNDEEGEPCSTGCGENLLYDRYERMVYCVNDWYHG